MGVRVGVIGTGNMGADHAQTLHRSIAGAEVVCLTDIDAERAQSVAATLPGSRVVRDALSLIEDSAVDAVVIASLDSTHAEYALACVAARKPVMCEKPLAPTLADCRRVVAAEEKAGGGLISMGFMRRFDPGFKEMKAAVMQGSIGAPLRITCVSRNVVSQPGTTSESSVTNSAIHDFDIVPWLLDSPIVEVSWHAPRRTSVVSPDIQDPQLILLRTADDVLSSVDVFLNAQYGYDVRYEVLGERGAVSLVEPLHLVTDAAQQRSVRYPLDWRPRFADAYRLELQAWVDAVGGGTPSPLASARDGLVAGTVADAVITSMHGSGRVVKVGPAT